MTPMLTWLCVVCVSVNDDADVDMALPVVCVSVNDDADVDMVVCFVFQ